jgi:hypothetical protein
MYFAPILLAILIRGICGLISMVIARKKGRSQIGWFFGGFFLGLIGIIIVAVISSLNEEDDYREYITRENRRLKEQLRQEQIKSEGFRSHVSHRLDEHDGVLGLDTKQTPAQSPLLPESGSLALGVNNPEESRGSNGHNAQAKVNWFYEKEGKQFGPVTVHDISSLLRSGMISDSSLVWKEGLQNWIPLLKVPELRLLLY